MHDEVPEGVGETAVGAAMMRARESSRPGGLFVDPYAAAFVAAAPPIFEDGPDAAGDAAIALLEAAFEEVVAVRTTSRMAPLSASSLRSESCPVPGANSRSIMQAVQTTPSFVGRGRWTV